MVCRQNIVVSFKGNKPTTKLISVWCKFPYSSVLPTNAVQNHTMRHSFSSHFGWKFHLQKSRCVCELLVNIQVLYRLKNILTQNDLNKSSWFMWNKPINHTNVSFLFQYFFFFRRFSKRNKSQMTSNFYAIENIVRFWVEHGKIR